MPVGKGKEAGRWREMLSCDALVAQASVDPPGALGKDGPAVLP